MKIEVCLRVLAENKWITKNYQKKEILVHVLKRIKREKIISERFGKVPKHPETSGNLINLSVTNENILNMLVHAYLRK